MFRKLVGLVFCFVALISFSVTAHGAATVEHFNPEGFVKGVRQVTARFSHQMVAFGDPRLSDPFDVSCPAKGKGRWVDGKNWSYDFDADLPAGTLCTFTIKPGIKTLAGEAITGPSRFTFNTGGPSVVNSVPYEGNEYIDERQRFIFTLDAEADEASLVQRVYCSVEGVEERIGIRLLKGKEKDDFLKTISYRKDTRPLAIFDCRRTFPPKSVVKVVWGKGVKSKSGLATAEDQVLPYRTRDAFTAEFGCLRETPRAGCMPLSPMHLRFTSPVPEDLAAKITLKDKQGKAWKSANAQDTTGQLYAIAGGKVYEAKVVGAKRFVQSLTFEPPFPANTAFTINMPKGLKDDAGRALVNADKFPLKVRTHSYPPLAKFSSTFGILESAEGGILPVTVRNIETQIKAWLEKTEVKNTETAPSASSQPTNKAADKKGPNIDQTLKGSIHLVSSNDEEAIMEWTRRLHFLDRRKSIFQKDERPTSFTVPRPGPKKAFEVLGIPLKEPGFYLVELESKILGSHLLSKPAPMYVPTSALVTNMAAHFQWGKASSLVWVTSLDKAEPVKDAAVTIRDCTGTIVWKGVSDAEGLARIPGSLTSTHCPLENNREKTKDKDDENWNNFDSPQAYRGVESGLFIFAKKGSDLTFTHSSWDEGIDPWRFNLPTNHPSQGHDDYITHTVFDRTLFRAGETVHMKHFIRREDMMKGFVIPDKSALPDETLIKHMGSDQEYTIPIQWAANGTAQITWEIPKNAKLGQYEVYLKNKDGNQTQRLSESQSGSFQVEEFRVPLLKPILKGPKSAPVNPKDVDVDVSLTYLSGGGASGAPVKLRSELRQTATSFEDYEEFTFSNGAVKKGIEKSHYTDMGGESYFEEGQYEDGVPVIERRGSEEKQEGKLKTIETNLDSMGGARIKIEKIPSISLPTDLFTELEFRDPNGETQTASTTISLFPAGIHVGIAGDWASNSKDTLKHKIMVVDLKGKPMPGIEAGVAMFQRKTYSHRKRITGGFYAYDQITEIVDVGPYCQGKTDDKGMLFCEGKSPVEGEVIFQAEARDSAGNLSTANVQQYVYGKEDFWFEAGQDDRYDLIPEKRRSEPGETARFQVRMPFKEATVLVTVEREGVMDTYVRKVSRSQPIIEVPIKNHYAPNVFISALVVRGRVADAQATALFDPGRPAYKLGITEIKVGWKQHELKVAVTPAREVYRIRENVEAKIHVKTAFGEIPPKGTEVAVAAVDEGLLELKANESWKLLEAMMRRRPIEVSTSTAQMMVVGKRHFGKKAMPHGGGGGKGTTRELFDTLLIWKGKVVLDEKGEAVVKIPLNDSLTSFRIVAVAEGGGSLFGTGSASVRTTQDLMILSGLPPLVREADRFTAGFTLRNTTDQAVDIETKLAVNGKSKEYPPIAGSLAAGESREIGWEVTVPYGVEKLIYEASLTKKGGGASDTVKITQTVVPAVPVRTFQATLMQVKEPVRMSVEKPADAIPLRGGINIGLKPKIAAGLDGVKEYMRLYPYPCFEQRTSKAIALRDDSMWKKLMDDLPSYMDNDGLVKYFPCSICLGSDVLTSYVLSIADEAQYEIPEKPRAKMIEGLKAFTEGRITRWSDLPTTDLAIRKVAAVEALSRYKASQNSLLNSVTIEPNLWPTSAVLDWISVLERTSDIPGREAKTKQAHAILRSRLNFQGTIMGLSTEKSDYCWWLMVSPDTNAVRTLVTALDFNTWDEDSPRIARGVVGRMERGHWNTTVANAWGVLAMEKFSKKFESTPVTGATTSTLGGKTATLDWSRKPEGGESLLPWPKTRDTVAVEHQGTGRPWLTVQSLAAIPLKEPLSTGYKIKKTVTPVEQKVKGKWSKGDVANVLLEIDAQSDMTWVVVNDPVPAGSTILGSGLGRDSSILTKKEREGGWAREVYRERSFEAMRAYFSYVWKGKFTVSYTVRLNNEGSFNLPSTRVEALYAPEMFGEIPNGKMIVAP